MSIENAYEILIREYHLDSFGHVNNAMYLEMYEEARWELITGRGYGMREVHKLGQGPVILEINLKFIKELRLREKVYITTELLSYKDKICQIKQQILKADSQVASELILTMGLFDLKERKLILPTPLWKKALGMSEA